MIEALYEFKKECVLEDEIKNTREKLKVVLKETREREEEHRRRVEEEGKKREEEIRRRKEEEENKWESYWYYGQWIGFYAFGKFTRFSDEDLKSG